LGDIDEWLEGICARQKIPPFRIRVQEGDLANAFAIGGLFRHLIVIGGGLIDGMPTDQVKAVLAHEIAHVIRRDVPRFLLPLSVVSGTCWLFCLWYFANPLFEANTVSGILAGGAVAGLSAVTFMIAIPSYSMRRMEYRADRLAVELLGDGQVFADALRTLAALNEQPIRQGHWSHPSTLKRIRAIEESIHSRSSLTTVDVAAARRTDNPSGIA
jgi:Zn-dependent protease with chaperone function